MAAMNALGARSKRYYQQLRRDALRVELRTRQMQAPGLKAELEDRLVRDDVAHMRQPRMLSQLRT